MLPTATAPTTDHSSPMDTTPAGRRRRASASRRVDTPLLSRFSLLGGRRWVARRKPERNGYIADQHGTWLFVVAGAVILMNILDALYTMLFLSYGGVEMNPIIDWVLVHGGVAGFLAVKSVGIGLCVGFLTLTKNFTASRIGLAVVIVGYSVLMSWHFYLLGRLPI